MHFRSKSNVVNAFQFRPDEFKKLRLWQLEETLPEWFIEANLKGQVSLTLSQKVNVITFYGKNGEVRKAEPGDWVCMDAQGKIFPLTEDEMNKGFEPDGSQE